MSDLLRFILPFVVVCVLYFVISRLWIGLIDGIIAFFKRLFKK